MAEPIYDPVGIGPSPPPVNGRPANPDHPNITTPSTNNGPWPGQNPNPSGHRNLSRFSDIDAPGTPDIDLPRTPQPLPLNPFQPNWLMGHPLPWNAYYQQHPDIEQSPFILGINRQG